MAKRKKPKYRQCDTPNCFVHKLWPSMAPALGRDATYHIDPTDGEIVVRTGLRLMPDGEVTPCPWEYRWRVLVCPDCKRKGRVRADCHDTGRVSKCPYCSAIKPIAEMS